MAAWVKCRICEEKVKYTSNSVDALGQHLLEKHPGATMTHYSFGNDDGAGLRRRCQFKRGPMAGGDNKLINKRQRSLFKTSVESWSRGIGEMTCPICKKTAAPLLRKERNKNEAMSNGNLERARSTPSVEINDNNTSHNSIALSRQNRHQTIITPLAVGSNDSFSHTEYESVNSDAPNSVGTATSHENSNTSEYFAAPPYRITEENSRHVNIHSRVSTTFQDEVQRNCDINNQATSSVPQESVQQTSGHHVLMNISSRATNNGHNEPRASSRSNDATTYQNVTPNSKIYRCYRALTGNTCSDIEVSIAPSPIPPRVQQGAPPVMGAPPTYSAVMRLGDNPNDILNPFTTRSKINIRSSPPFIAPPRPPSYAEVEGFPLERQLFMASVEQVIWGPDPLSVICPMCLNVVVTATCAHRSNLTHFSALALCLCGCWPCCLLPYCMDSCKNTYHNCPTCNQLLGMYRPW